MMRISKFVRYSGEAKGKKLKPLAVEPYIIMFKNEKGGISCHIYPKDYTYEMYGMLICDLVRNVANAFDVKENDVWEWVDKERFHHTTDITFETIRQ